MPEDKPEFLVFEGKKDETNQSAADNEESIIKIVEKQIADIREDEEGMPLRKVMFITCFGEEDNDDYDKFTLTAINITARDFVHIAERIKLQYLLNEM